MTVVTFYSYKGGVGRSILLANTAVLLAKMGKRVVCLDFDLDAGGLHKIFNINEIDIKSTTLDVLLGERMTFVNLDKRLNITGGHLNILPNISEPHKLSRVVAQSEEGGGYIGNKFALIIESIKKDKNLNPEFILVDTRSGISEIFSRVANISNLFVLVLKPNKQNIEGTKRILESINTREATEHLIVLSQVLTDKQYMEKLEIIKSELTQNINRPEELAYIEFDRGLLYEEFIPALFDENFEKDSKYEGYRKVANWIRGRVGL